MLGQLNGLGIVSRGVLLGGSFLLLSHESEITLARVSLLSAIVVLLLDHSCILLLIILGKVELFSFIL